MLSLHQLTDSTDLSFCMDNEALFDINQRQLKIANPDFKDLNRVRRAVLILSSSMFHQNNTNLVYRSSPASCAASRRLCGSQASLMGALRFQRGRGESKRGGSDECGDYDYYYRDLRKLAMNLIPFPRLHYLLPSYGPLVGEGHAAYQGSTVNELVGSCVPPLPVVVSFQSSTNAVSLPPRDHLSLVVFSLFDRHNLLVACDPRYGRYLTAATIFRGQLSAQEVEIAIEQLQSKNSSLFVECVSSSINPSPCSVLQVFVDGSICFFVGL